MAAITAGRIQINKKTKEIQIDGVEDYPEEKEEIELIVDEYLIKNNYPNEYIYAEG